MSYVICVNPEYKSLEVSFDEKPSAAIREALKALHFRWHGVKKVWYGYGETPDSLKAAIDSAGAVDGEIETSAPAEPSADMEAAKAQAALREEYRALLAKGGETDYWISYYMKKAGHFFKLSGGEIFVIEKPKVETDFCFGESGYDYEEAGRMAALAAESQDYFKRRNLEDLQEWIDFLARTKDGYEYRDNLVYTVDKGIAHIFRCSSGDRIEHDYSEVSEEDRDRLLAVYRMAYAAFEKRLDAYLKRYGMSKVRTWTYWRDA